MMTSISELPGVSMLSQLAELRNAWEQDYPKRAQGGLLALSGFEYQFLLTLLKIVHLWKASTDAERQDLETARKILAEAISDITESGRDIAFTQVKRTLSASGFKSALKELWEIFKLASERTPDLAEHLRFVISGQFEGHKNPQQIIQEWGPQPERYSQQELRLFKERVCYDLVPDPRSDLSTELQVLARDENTETTIARWLGYLLQLGSGFSPESISTFIWKELANDGSIEAFRATLARLCSLSHSRLCVIRETLGDHITLPRAKLSDLRASLFKKNVTLLIGSSGSGKSALCKVGIQQDFRQNFDCLFLHASDIASFTESFDVIANRGLRRLDELLIARITQKPTLVVIDDLSDVDDQHFDIVLNLLHNTLTADPLSDVRFILVAHVDARRRIHEKISARFGNDSVYDDVELPQLPVEELVSSEALPNSVISLIQRHQEFGPALNLKLIDWLVRSAQREQVDTAVFQSDLDLLTWFWHDHVQDSQDSSNLGQVLIRIAKELADRFTPDLPRDFDPLTGEALYILVRRDCLRIVSERLATTHRFVGDCARFYYLRGNRREIESEQLVEWLQNPFWVQPIRWFALQLALESSEGETWQEFLYEALGGEHLQLLDLLLDGAILSKQPAAILQMCPDESLSFVVERLITRLLVIATEPYPFHADSFQSTPLRTRIAIQEKITGIPKPDLWEPVWHWLLFQNPETVIEESCIVFRATEAWLNWGTYAESFLLRSEVAEFTLDLAQRVLLPNPVLQEIIIKGTELPELIDLRQQGVLPEAELIRRRSYYLGDFESNAFSCIVFALRILPERSAWFLRVLAGREIVPTNKLEPTRTSRSLTRPGVGVLETPHPQGPLGEVNHEFRKFMLNRNGWFLNAVMLTSPQLGVELFLGLTIQPPRYRYDSDAYSDRRDEDLGTEGSDDIDVCTFKFLPLLSLLEINEEVAIRIVNTLCRIATLRNYEICESLEQRRSQSEENSEVSSLLDSLRADTHELTLIINGTNKKFQGERKALYWHRNCPLSPKIINCLLMSLEGWLYSRPTKSQLEHSISVILNRSDTVAILGVLVTLAKCDFSLLSGALLPFVSSLQLLIWLEFEQTDQGQNYGFDDIGARELSGEDRQELLEFNQLSYRRVDLQKIILNLWINEVITSEIQSQILENWDTHQLPLIPKVSFSRASRIRARFELSNWQQEEIAQGEQGFRFVGTLPEDADADADAKAESAFLNLHLQIVMMCRQILDGERGKTLELHNQLVDFLTSDQQITLLKERLEHTKFFDTVYAALAVLLEPPVESTNLDIENIFNDFADSLANVGINIDYRSRCQLYNLDASAFIAHMSPKLLRRVESDNTVRAAAFRCFIGQRNCDTSSFMHEWVREYGFTHPLTQELIDVAPRIARFIAITEGISYAKHIQQYVTPDGYYAVPLLDQHYVDQENPLIEKAWLCFQKDFVERSIDKVSIIKVFQWLPEIFLDSLQEMPSWLYVRVNKKYFDWDFLAAALIPALKARANDEEVQNYINSLCEQILLAILYERKVIYDEYKLTQEEGEHTPISKRFYKAQSQLLDAVVKYSHIDTITLLKRIFHILNDFQLVDCILLECIIDTLNYRFNQGKITLLARNCVALAIGDYLFEFRSQPDSDLQVLGKVSDVWEKLIVLLSRESGDSEDVAVLDKFLVQFFSRFCKVLLPHWLLRKRLYRVAKSSEYKQFRQIIFQAVVKHSDLLPDNRNDESESLVQVLAELWDSDCTWIIKRQSRCQDLRTLLGHLQEIDAVGARSLADQVASFLSNPGG